MTSTASGMVKQKGKLWGQVERIVQSKASRFGGTKYEVKLIGVDKSVWVQEKQLSKSVHKTYQTDGSLTTGAMAQVNRGYVIEQRKFLKKKVCYLLALIYYLRGAAPSAPRRGPEPRARATPSAWWAANARRSSGETRRAW